MEHLNPDGILHFMTSSQFTRSLRARHDGLPARRCIVPSSHVRPHAAVLLLFLSHFAAPDLAAGLPEPGLAIYGELRGMPSTQLAGATLTWTTRQGSEPPVTTRASWVVVNGAAYHLALVPFETRVFPGGLRLEATQGTHELGAAPATYTRTVALGEQSLRLLDAKQASFTFGAGDRGRVDRVDLELGGSTQPTDSDTDGDGMSDAAEALAGTDPQDPGSVLRLHFDTRPAAGGEGFDGITFRFSSVAGRRYVIERSLAVNGEYRTVAHDLVAEGAMTIFSDPGARGYGPFFYRLRLR